MISSISQCLLDEFNWSGQISAGYAEHAQLLMAARLVRMKQFEERQMSPAKLSLTRLQPALEFLLNQPEQKTTLNELAQLCGASVYHFARSFTLQLGCAPFAYQRNVRLEKAKRLLQDSDMDIEAIGMAVGLDNPSNCSRAFRHAEGVSPMNYRKSQRNNRKE